MLRSIAYLSILFFSMVPCLSGATQITPQFPDFDGEWWVAVSVNERLGFIEGYFECYENEYKGPDSFGNSNDQHVAWITERYKNDCACDLERSVLSQIHELRDLPGGGIADTGGGTVIVPSGLEWSQMDAVAESNMEPTGLEHRGFVEGYLACHAELNHNKGGVFSKSADSYVNDIDRWYGYNKSTGDENPDREGTPIAAVLFKFADKPQSSKPPRS
jgi:hypothetical protein